jgi:uncharacterized iron-regulated membrane protein
MNFKISQKFKNQYLKPLHLYFGLISGIVVFIVSITGCLYSFAPQINNYLYKDILFVKAEGKPKPIGELMQIAQKKFPKQKIRSIHIRTNPEASYRFVYKKKANLYINPYNGKILGSRSSGLTFLNVVLRLHKNLYLGKIGAQIVRFSTLVFLFMIVSGIVLWWPLNKNLLGQKLTIKRNTTRARRIYDLHNVPGFYALWIIVFSVLTGIFWSFKVAEAAVFKLSFSERENVKSLKSNLTTDSSNIEDVIQTIYLSGKDFYKNSDDYLINLPVSKTTPVKLTAITKTGTILNTIDHSYYDSYTGNLIKNSLFKTKSFGDKIKLLNYDIHTGLVIGITGQFLVFFASLTVASLPITGFLIWWGKRKRSSDRKSVKTR